MNGKSLSHIVSSGREVMFTHRGEAIHPGTVFELVYHGLDTLVSHNLAQREAGGHMSDRNEIRMKTHSGVAKQLSKRWLEEEKPDIGADVVFDDGKKVHYTVERRTNFDAATLFKFPNIVQLHGENGEVLVLREARKHDFDTVILAHVAKRVKHFDKAASGQFYEEGEGQVNPASGKNLLYVPEPNLLAALETNYHRGMRRITPEVKAIDADSTRLWFLREFLPAAVDVSMSPQLMGAYFGKLQAIGLMEPADRQIIHYSKEGPRIVNYDPDFVMHTTNTEKVKHDEWTTIEDAFMTDKDLIRQIPQDIRGYLGQLKDRIKEVRSKYESQGYNPVGFLKDVRREISLDAFPRFEYTPPRQ